MQRNIGIIAHVDAGKTSLTEQILHLVGKIHRVGKVHDGDAAMDAMDQERERGITIQAAATSFDWHDVRFTLIDTPGHSDFGIEVERALRVLDGAILLVDAVSGVQAQTEAVFRQARRYGVPALLVVNKMDRVGADFAAALRSVEDRLGVATLAIAQPEGQEADFVGLQHVDWQQWADPLAMLDEQLLEKHGMHTEADVLAALVRSVQSGELLAALPASAKNGIGVEDVLDWAAKLLPGPEAIDTPETVAYLFKQTVDARFGALSWLRVYAGGLTAGMQLRVGKDRHRLGQLSVLHANSKHPVERAMHGQIVAATGLDKITSGVTLSTSGEIALEGLQTQEPLVQLAVSADDAARLGSALQSLTGEDPSLHSWVDVDSGQTILAGVGELQLEVILERVRREWQLAVRASAPQVALRATLRRAVTATGRNVNQGGGRGQYAIVVIEAQPGELGSGFVIEDHTTGGSIPREFMRGVVKGLEEAAQTSAMDGWPLVDTLVRVIDGKIHAVDSSEMAFRVAGRLALEDAQEQAGLDALEPMVRIDLDVPDEFIGSVIGELQKRGGIVHSIDSERVSARMPLAGCFGWMNALRSLTQGRGAASMTADGYQLKAMQAA